MMVRREAGALWFKCTDHPPHSQLPSVFLTNEGLPSDHYLWLTDKASEMLRGERPIDEDLYLKTDR